MYEYENIIKQVGINKDTYEIAEKEKNDDEANAPTEYGKYVDRCFNEASKYFVLEGVDKYSVADLFYAGVKCGKSWLEKKGECHSQIVPEFTFNDVLALQCCMETAKKVQEDKDLYEELKDLHGRVYAYHIKKQSDKPQGKTALEAIFPD